MISGGRRIRGSCRNTLEAYIQQGRITFDIEPAAHVAASLRRPCSTSNRARVGPIRCRFSKTISTGGRRTRAMGRAAIRLRSPASLFIQNSPDSRRRSSPHRTQPIRRRPSWPDKLLNIYINRRKSIQIPVHLENADLDRPAFIPSDKVAGFAGVRVCSSSRAGGGALDE